MGRHRMFGIELLIIVCRMCKGATCAVAETNEVGAQEGRCWAARRIGDSEDREGSVCTGDKDETGRTRTEDR
jgi:hypothetical protein